MPGVGSGGAVETGGTADLGDEAAVSETPGGWPITGGSSPITGGGSPITGAGWPMTGGDWDSSAGMPLTGGGGGGVAASSGPSGSVDRTGGGWPVEETFRGR